MISVLIVVKLFLLVVCVLVGVAFVTYYERKFLSYMQVRKGPNKVGYKGLLQPFSDAVKLFLNEVMLLNFSNYWFYLLSPLLMFWLMMVIWLGFPSSVGLSEMVLGVVFVLCCLSVGVYPPLGAGWVSNSKYPMLGSLRNMAQTISYEVSMILIMLSFIIIVGSFNLEDYLFVEGVWVGVVSMPLMGVWFVSLLAETNRTPFDLSEGESELVSGFNTEYGGGLFALFFLAEYGSLLFMSGLFSVFFLGGGDLSGGLFLKLVLVALCIVWIRGVLPRVRYDKLMMLAWKLFLPVSLLYLCFFLGVSLFFCSGNVFVYS